LDWREDLHLGVTDPKGHQLRPHIVWFGEAVPMLERAVDICQQADILVIIGTSLLVYPAANLVHYVPVGIPKIIIDPEPPQISGSSEFDLIQAGASEGVGELMKKLI